MESLQYRRRVQARKDASDNESVEEPGVDASSSDIVGSASTVDQNATSSDMTEDENDESDESRSNDSDAPPENEAASISFGALARAQEILGKRKRGSEANEDDLHDSKRNEKANAEYVNSEALERKAGKKDMRDFSRTSKHAPAEVSSKKAVSRKREVVPSQKIDYRDPRFEPVNGPLDQQKTKKNYSFLDTYRDSEISELKSAIRKTKDPEAKEKLKRALLSMESRKKAQQLKEQEQEVLRGHRKEEKTKVEQGKKPFFLKKTDQKKLALMKRFEGMKGKQVDKVIERRRKKQAAKERKTLPEARRG